MAERIFKRKISKLYADDFRKIDPTGRIAKFFMSIPGQLNKKAAHFQPTTVVSNVENEKMLQLLSDLKDNKVAAFGSPQTPVTTAINIKSDYEAKYGAPTSGAPKVFFKYFYVNSSTGEKSGEVLLEGKLASE